MNDRTDPIPKCYEYIDIKQTLKNILEDPSYIEQELEDPYLHSEGIVKDLRDGSVYRNNRFFQENRDAIPIILFADEFEVANPLGAGKVRHKINATYMTLGSVKPALRNFYTHLAKLFIVTFSRFS